MSINKKIMLLVAVQVVTILLQGGMGLGGIGYMSSANEALYDHVVMSLVNEQVPELIALEKAQKELLNADRDTYQAMLASTQGLSAQSPELIALAAKESIATLDQVAERLTEASEVFDAEMIALYEELASSYESLEVGLKAIFAHLQGHEMYQDVFDDLMESTQQDFLTMRTKIDALNEHLDGKVAEIIEAIEVAKANAALENQAVVGMGQRTLFFNLGLGVFVITVVIVFSVRMLSGLVRSVSSAVEVLTSGSRQVQLSAHQLTSVSQQLAQGTSEQAASLEETSAGFEEISTMLHQNEHNAQRAQSRSMEAQHQLRAGNEAVHRVLETMGDISQASSKVASIIKAIEDIAFQTNILALNAAVEAARAGDAGRGFSVVADEVRSLAQRSAQSSRETAELVAEAMRSIQEGSRSVGSLEQRFEEIITSTRDVIAFVEEITTASREQSQGILQITESISMMNTITERNAANAEETASSSEELLAQTETFFETTVKLNALIGAEVSEG